MKTREVLNLTFTSVQIAWTLANVQLKKIASKMRDSQILTGISTARLSDSNLALAVPLI